MSAWITSRAALGPQTKYGAYLLFAFGLRSLVIGSKVYLPLMVPRAGPAPGMGFTSLGVGVSLAEWLYANGYGPAPLTESY